MSKLLWGPLKAGSWPIRPIPIEFRRTQISDVQTLLLSGSIDLGTPAEFATNDLLPLLSQGRQIVLAECGHMDIEWTDPENAQRILTSFYRTGIPDTSLNRYVPMDFRVSWGFSRMARMFLAAVVVFVLGLSLSSLWLIGFLRKRN